MNTSLEQAIEKAALRLEPDEDDIAMQDEWPLARPETRRAVVALCRSILSKMTVESIDTVPRFGVSGNGSVDLHWSHRSGELLVCLNDAGKIQFFGQIFGEENTKGSVTGPAPVEVLAKWLDRLYGPLT